MMLLKINCVIVQNAGNEIIPVRGKFDGKLKKAVINKTLQKTETTKLEPVTVPTTNGGTVIINNYNSNPTAQSFYTRK